MFKRFLRKRKFKKLNKRALWLREHATIGSKSDKEYKKIIANKSYKKGFFGTGDW